MYVELIVSPGAEVWYGLVDFEWPEDDGDIEYEEPEFKRRKSIRISDFKVP